MSSSVKFMASSMDQLPPTMAHLTLHRKPLFDFSEHRRSASQNQFAPFA
jgi:hypothetical protein